MRTRPFKYMVQNTFKNNARSYCPVKHEWFMGGGSTFTQCVSGNIID